MANTRKVVISTGYGAGWSTWNDPALATDPRVIAAVENEELQNMAVKDVEKLLASWGFPDTYCGGAKGLICVEIEEGTLFRISEYDGYEDVEVFDPADWLTA